MKDNLPPLLSVIIPAHNEENTICRTVDSLLRQSYSHYEIVIVDDGSEDKTVATLREHYHFSEAGIIDHPLNRRRISVSIAIRNDIHLFLIEKSNGGKGDALNTGISYCHGALCACIDADCVLLHDALSILVHEMERNNNTVAVGGRVIPQLGFLNTVLQEECSMRDVLQSFQELEYGIAFRIARPIFDRIGTTMLISGALGVFRKEVVVQLGGYASDTVGEDMELVMRIRQYAADNQGSMIIGYTQSAVCLTELPWKVIDWIKQRIRWTVGLTEVLWKYRSVITNKEYSIAEKLTFWFYLLFEKFSPHLVLISWIILLLFGSVQYSMQLIVLTILLQLILSIVGSYRSIRHAIRKTDNKIEAIAKFLVLLLSFITIYQVVHAVVRLVSVPWYCLMKLVKKSKSVAWNSPKRM